MSMVEHGINRFQPTIDNPYNMRSNDPAEVIYYV